MYLNPSPASSLVVAMNILPDHSELRLVLGKMERASTSQVCGDTNLMEAGAMRPRSPKCLPLPWQLIS